jgi:hypothetical protein
MEFNLTERMALFLKRCVEINIDNFEETVEKFKKLNRQEFHLLFNDEDFGSMFFYSYSDTKLNIEMRLDFWGTNGIDKNNAHVVIFIKYGRCLLFNFDYHDDDYKENIDKLVKKFVFCRCGGNLPKKDDWCEECFPYVVSQENNCCVCLENEGVWTKLLDCNHILHSYCWEKTKKSQASYEPKCPLCRTINTNWVNI